MRIPRGFALAAALSFAAQVQAQDTAQAPKLTPEQQKIMEAWTAAATPGPQHQQIMALAGTFDAASSMWWAPGSPPEQSTAKVVNEAIYGGRYLKTTYNGTWAGQAFEGQGLTGYDNARKKYFGTWADSMATATSTLYGDYDAATKTYTFHGEFADPAANGAMVKVRQLMKVDSNDRYTMTWHETRGTGPESRTMEIVYTRSK